jgi:hypothetical protein
MAAGVPGIAAALAPRSEAFRIQIHRAGGTQRRNLAPIHDHLESVASPMEQPEATAAEARPVRFHDRQHGAHGDRGIESVATRCQHVFAGAGRQGVRARDGSGRRGRTRARNARTDHLHRDEQ